MSLKEIEEELYARLKLEDAIEEIKNLSPSESAIEKIVQELESKDKKIDKLETKLMYALSPTKH